MGALSELRGIESAGVAVALVGLLLGVWLLRARGRRAWPWALGVTALSLLQIGRAHV